MSIIIVCILTVLIHFIGILSISVRIVGIHTRKVASSVSLFNIINLIAQFANTIQAPILAKTIEQNIILGTTINVSLFRTILFSATFGGILGALAIPTTYRFMIQGVNSLYRYQSVFKVFTKSCNRHMLTKLYQSLTPPNTKHLLNLSSYHDIPKGIVLLNIVVYAFITTSVLSCLYAGYLNTSLRATALSMNGFSIGVGTIGMMLFIEPFNATLTDKVINGTVSEDYFKRYLTFVILARILGTLLSQFILAPLALLIIKLTAWIYV